MPLPAHSRPPDRGRCACTPAGIVQNRKKRAAQALRLVKRLARTTAPGPTIGGPLQTNHAKTMIIRIPSGVANDDDVVAGFQRFAGDALTPKLAAAAPFDSPSNGFSLLIFAFHMHERMWIAEQELNQIAFNRLLLVFEVGRREGMMRIKLNSRHQRRQSNH